MLSKIVSTIQDSANALLKCKHFLSRDNCLECLPRPFTYSYQNKTRGSVINWLCGKFSHIFSPVRFLIQKLFWA